MSKRYVRAKGIQNVPKGSGYPNTDTMYPKNTKMSKVAKGYIRSDVSKRHLKVQGIQKEPIGTRYPKGT